MLNKILFTVALAGFVLTAAAQSKPKITLGKPYDVVDAVTKLYYRKGDEILTIKITKKDKYILQKFNAKTLTFQKAKMYDDLPSQAVMEKITKFNTSYYLFYSLWDGENEQLFAREIDFNTGELKLPAKKIITVSDKMSGVLGTTGSRKLTILDKFNFFFSYDSTRLLVKYTMKPKVKDDSKSFEVVGAHVFSQDLKEHWHSQLTMPYTEKKMNVLDYSIDTHNNVYAVSKVFNDNSTDEKKRGEDEANYGIEIFKFSQPDGKLTKTKVNIEGKFLQSLWIYENSSKNYMVCAGFYNKGNSATNVDGIILFKLGSDNRYYDLYTHPIPLEILNQNATRKAIRKNERAEDGGGAEFKSLELREIRMQKDGSVLLISEQHYVVSTYQPGMNGQPGSSTTTYYYNDMLVAKVDASGKLSWMDKLAKRQQGGAPRRSMSFKYFTEKGNHHFVFVDNPKNKSLNPKDVPEVYDDGRKGYLTDYVVSDKTGVVMKNYLVDLDDVNGVEVYQFSPSRIIPATDGTFIFESYKKGKEDILIKVDGIETPNL